MSKYFIIIDMQNDFVSGALKNDAAAAIVPAIVEKAKALKEQGYTIIATRDTHQANYMDTQEGKNLPVPHCLEGTPGWEVVDEIKPFVDKYVDKPSFGYAHWNDVLSVSPEAVELCGTVTEICVISNATVIKAEFPEVPVTVYKDLCAGLGSHQAALDVMKSTQVTVL